MVSGQTSSKVSEHVFVGSECLADYLRALNLDSVVRSRSDQPSTVRSLEFARGFIKELRLGPPITTVGATAGDMVAIGLPLCDAASWRVDGRQFDGSILVGVPHREHFITTPGDVHFLTLLVDRQDFFEQWRTLTGLDGEPSSAVVQLAPEERHRFRAIGGAMVRFLARATCKEHGHVCDDGRFAAAWKSVILDITVLAMAAALPRVPRLKVAGARRIMLNAIEFVRRHPAAAPSVSDLCTVCATNERSLRQAFVQTVGMGPRAYLRVRRLHLARRCLQTMRGDDVSVARVATDHGFFDLGRFAGDYRQLFGELPSETLRRA